MEEASVVLTTVLKRYGYSNECIVNPGDVGMNIQFYCFNHCMQSLKQKKASDPFCWYSIEYEAGRILEFL